MTFYDFLGIIEPFWTSSNLYGKESFPDIHQCLATRCPDFPPNKTFKFLLLLMEPYTIYRVFLSTVTNKSSIIDTTVQSLTHFGLFLCTIHPDIWYFMSNNPEIGLERVKVTPRKNVRFFGLAQF